VDTSPLQPLIGRFLDSQTSDPLIVQQSQEHRRRIQEAQAILTSERIPTLARDELAAFLQDTDAWYGVRGKQQFWRRLFGEHDERLPDLHNGLLELVRRGEAGLVADDFSALLNTLHGIGPAFLSEVLALRFPDRYWLWNGQVQAFLNGQSISLKEELPWGKKGDRGEEYMAVGHHLEDLRRAISQAAGQAVDYMLADLFVYWANRQEKAVVTPWAERIARWVAELLPEERIEARKQGEARARALLEGKLGRFDGDDLRQFLRLLSADWYNGKDRYDRFMPALYGSQVLRMMEDLPAFNRWAKRVWEADEPNLDTVLDEFWTTGEVGGAGASLPTAWLYLRDPLQYHLWLPVMSRGLQAAEGFIPGPARTAAGYRHYVEALSRFRETFGLSPQALDVILWKINGETGMADFDGDGDVVGEGFTGFTPETFGFLQDLAANNNDHWMHKDDNANELRFRRVLREPLRALLQAVAPAVRQVSPIFETEVKFGKVLAGIKKRWPDEATGPYHPYLWGAFYRAGRSKQTDAQLFVNVHPDHVNVGFSVAGSQGSDVIGRFRRNLQQAPDIFLRLLAALPEDLHIALAERHGMAEKTVVRDRGEDLLKVLQEAGLIDVERRYPADAPILTRPEFADEVAQLFTRLYPLYRFAIADDPQTLLPPEETEEEETTELPIQRYTFDGLCAETYLDDGFWRRVEDLLKRKRQIIFYGPPGTGKTFLARCLARYWVETGTDPGGDIRVIQFHPSYAYEDFVEGIRPQSIETRDGKRELDYPVKKGVFRRFCEEAQGNPKRRYVLILDEINRGELPRILGELLYLLEYRTESVFLPYSGEQFAIPPNLYLVGTMNTADRSIALVDHALRRRFHFVPLKPSPVVLRSYLEGNGNPDMVWLADLLEIVNQRLTQDGIEWHLHIGHSHFMQADMDEVALRLEWDHSVLPTLEEYFYRQPDRLRVYQLNELMAALGRA